MTKEELIVKLNEDYKQLTSLSIYSGDEEKSVRLVGARYRGDKNGATLAQVRYLQGLANVIARSTSNLLKANKWFISACIKIAKENEGFVFVISL